MTKEQAINYLKSSGFSDEQIEAVTEAFSEEHKTEHILDKIRAEIKAMFPPSGSWMYDEGHEVEHAVCEVLSDVLKIIDEYKEESEDKK